jgi:hypothetical protein
MGMTITQLRKMGVNIHSAEFARGIRSAMKVMTPTEKREFMARLIFDWAQTKRA